MHIVNSRLFWAFVYTFWSRRRTTWTLVSKLCLRTFQILAFTIKTLQSDLFLKTFEYAAFAGEGQIIVPPSQRETALFIAQEAPKLVFAQVRYAIFGGSLQI